MSPNEPSEAPAMGIDEIVRELEFYQGRFPREALEAAIAQRDAIVPHLMRFIEHAWENAEHLDDDSEATGGYQGHTYAMYLLAEFRETAAYPLIVKFFRLPRELSLDLTGDVATEDLPSILASVCGGDTSLIRGMVENPELNEWVRGAALRSFLCLVAAGEMPREEAIAYYTELFRGKLERQHSNAWDSLVCGAADLCAGELREDVRKAYDDGLADPFVATPEELERDIGRDKERVPEYLRGWRYGLIESAIERMKWWSCFREDRTDAAQPGASEPLPPPLEGLDEDDDWDSPWGGEAASPVLAEPSPGRNDPCPCGSGRKYKRCCAGKPKEAT